MPVVILPAGYHSLGFAEGVTFTSPSAPAAIIADDIDATTGEVNSLLSSVDPVDSAVINIARTERASGAAVLDVGHRFRSITKNNEQAPRLAEAYAREMYADLERDGRISIVSIDTTQFGVLADGLGLLITYDNLLSGTRRTVQI